MSRWKFVNGLQMGYNLLEHGVYWGYNPLTNLLLTSWDIQVSGHVKHGFNLDKFFEEMPGQSTLIPLLLLMEILHHLECNV